MLSGRSYLAVLTPEQEKFAEQVAGACRAAWNAGLAQRREASRRWRQGRSAGLPRVNYNFQAREVTEARAEHDWLRAAPVHVLQQALRDLDRACSAHGPWRTRFRSKGRWQASMRFPDPKQIRVTRLNKRWGEVVLPKFGPVRFRWTRALGGEVRSVTLRQSGGRWQVAFLVETGKAAPIAREPRRTVGLDAGVAQAWTTSNGEMFDRGFLTPGEQRRIKRLQQTLARQRRTNPNWRKSARRKQTRAELQAVFVRARKRRSDFQHQLAAQLTRNYDLVAVENLNVRNMSRSAAGTPAEPGSNVRQKAGLNRAILNKSWSTFTNQILSWHARKRGATIIAVPARHTSQTCPLCRNVDAKNRKSQAVFACTSCTFSGHADVVAAINIRERGTKLASAPGQGGAGRGDLASRRSVKRQPPNRYAARAA